MAKFASCVAVIGSPMVGSAALELATSFDVGYKNKCILHLLDTSWKRKKIVQVCDNYEYRRNLFMIHQ